MQLLLKHGVRWLQLRAAAAAVETARRSSGVDCAGERQAWLPARRGCCWRHVGHGQGLTAGPGRGFLELHVDLGQGLLGDSPGCLWEWCCNLSRGVTESVPQCRFD